MKIKQSQRSLLAIVMLIAFAVTGKLFVWKTKEPAPNLQIADQTGNILEMQQTSALLTSATTATTTVTTTTETTTTTTTEFAHFELIPPDDTLHADQAALTTAPPLTTETTTVTEITLPPETSAPAETLPAGNVADSAYFSDALFIGDSRTVGQALYAPIDGATYFATVGLSTYKIDAAVSEVPDTEGMSFAQAIGMKQFSKVYVMLGINELGMDVNTTMENFRSILSRIQAAQPNAIIILEANLHVAASRHNTDGVVNNTVINRFNTALAGLADNQKIFYLDVNPVFDDAYGCLKEEYTSDGTHPYAKHYAEWADFIRSHIFS